MEKNNLSWVGLTLGQAFATTAIYRLLILSKGMKKTPLAKENHEYGTPCSLMVQTYSPEAASISTQDEMDLIRVTEQMKPHLKALVLN